MVLIFLMARMLTQVGKVQRKYQEMSICESAYWSLQDKIIKAQQHNEPVGCRKQLWKPALSSTMLNSATASTWF